MTGKGGLLRKCVLCRRSCHENAHLSFSPLRKGPEVDWLSISVAVVVLILWFSLATESSNLQLQLGYLQRQEAQQTLERAVRVGHVATFYEAVEAVCAEEKRFRLILCFYPMLLLLRLFKSFAAQPRLAVVTDTIKLASQDLLHFGASACNETHRFLCVACLCMLVLGPFGP